MRRTFVASARLTVAVVALGCRAEARDAGVGDTSGAKQPRAMAAADCGALPSTDDFKRFLHAAPDSGEAGGLFHGRAEWAAIVNRKGQVCAVIPPSDSAGGYWPGSRTISMAKAFTANGFSTDTLALSRDEG